VIAGGERGQIGPELREEGGDRGRLEPGHLREIGPENPVELGAEIEPGNDGGAARGAAGPFAGRERVPGGIDRGSDRPEARLDLAVARPDEPLIMAVGVQRLPEGEEVLRPIVPDQGLGDRLRGSLDAVVAVAGEHVRIPPPQGSQGP
jgi:hypothetical protein